MRSTRCKRTHPWLDRNLARLRNTKRKPARKASVANDFSKDDALNEIFISKNKRAYDDYAEWNAGLLIENPKKFWNFVDKKRKIKNKLLLFQWPAYL